MVTAEVSGSSLRIRAMGSMAILLSVLGMGRADTAEHQHHTPSRAAIERGEKLYRDNCVSCHGARAYGDPASGVPSLAGQHSSYLLKQLVGFTGPGRDSSEMHPRMVTQALYSPR